MNKNRLGLWLKRIGIFLLAVLVTIQFFQPGKNNQSMDMANDISTVVAVPEEVHSILKTSCYDCHSNNTNYPWYTNIQPVGWWLKDHIDEGKGKLNFQDFATLQPRPGGRYKTARELQDHKLEEVAETVEEGEMPLKSYTIIHRNAILDETQKKLVTDWVKAAREELMKGGQATPPAPSE
jgi:hypothetical protein